MILAIDPGTTKSAYVLMDERSLEPVQAGIIENEHLLELVYSEVTNHFAIEMVASYGMPVGKEVFDTVLWIGRFWEASTADFKQFVYRKDEKINLCNSMKAKDGNIRQALIDRFGEVGTKKNKGFFYGFSKDMWSAFAVGTTYADMYLKGNAPS